MPPQSHPWWRSGPGRKILTNYCTKLEFKRNAIFFYIIINIIVIAAFVYSHLDTGNAIDEFIIVDESGFIIE
jgi:hypothetical protein